MKEKKCKSCNNMFIPDRPMMTTCSYECAIKYASTLQSKKKKQDSNKLKKEFNANDRKYLIEIAQKTCNTYIRIRDGKHCISCGYSGTSRQFHAGHFKSQGGNSALRFDESNIQSQCSICNTHLSGNLAEYRKNLIEKIGLEKVEYLETTKNTKLWTVEELKDIIKLYKQKIKDLGNGTM